MPTEKELVQLVVNKVDTLNTYKTMKQTGETNEDEIYLIEELNNLEFDTAPTENSSNLVTSGGVKNYVDEQIESNKKVAIVGTEITATAADSFSVGNMTYLMMDESNNYTAYSAMEGIPGDGFMVGIVLEDIAEGATGRINLIMDPKSSAGGNNGLPRKSTITLLASGWINNSQIVDVNGITADEALQIIQIVPIEEYEYVVAEIDCEVLGTNRLKFTAVDVPENDITVNVIVEDLVAQGDEENELFSGSAAVTHVATVTTNWTADGEYFYQDVLINGMTEQSNYFISCIMGDDIAVNEVNKEAFGLLKGVDTHDGYARFWCAEIPEIEFDVRFDTIGWYSVVNTYPAAEGVGF